MKPVLLCAIDKKTDAAVPRIAGGLASSLGANVLLIHVAKDTGVFESATESQRARDAAAGSSHVMLARARLEIPDGLQTEERVELGWPGEKLLEVAAAESPELIVTGCRGRGTLRSALFGSISRGLARDAPCPVLIVPPRAAARPASDPVARGIVCGVGSSERSLAVVRLGDELAGRLGDPLLLVHVHDTLYPTEIINYEEPQGMTRAARKAGGMAEALKRALDLVDQDARASVEVGAPPGHALAAVAARERARLIVVGAGGLGRMRFRAHDPSASAQLLSQATCPVLVLPESASVLADRHEYEADKAA